MSLTVSRGLTGKREMANWSPPHSKDYRWFWDGLYPSGNYPTREGRGGEKGIAKATITVVSDGCRFHPKQKCLECPENKCLLDSKRQEHPRVISLRRRVREMAYRGIRIQEIARELHITVRTAYRYLRRE